MKSIIKLALNLFYVFKKKFCIIEIEAVQRFLIVKRRYCLTMTNWHLKYKKKYLSSHGRTISFNKNKMSVYCRIQNYRKEQRDIFPELFRIFLIVYFLALIYFKLKLSRMSTTFSQFSTYFRFFCEKNVCRVLTFPFIIVRFPSNLPIWLILFYFFFFFISFI